MKKNCILIAAPLGVHLLAGIFLCLTFVIPQYTYAWEAVASSTIDISTIDESLLVGEESASDASSSRQPLRAFMSLAAQEAPALVERFVPLTPENTQDIWTNDTFAYDGVQSNPGGGLNNDVLRVGGWGDHYYSLMQFDISSLPDDVESVKIQLYALPQQGAGPLIMNLERITEYWNWHTQGTGRDRERLWWSDLPTTEFIRNLPTPTSTPSWYTVDITSLYRDWKSGLYPNYGVLFRPTTNRLIPDLWNIFTSSDYSADLNLRPRLVISMVATAPTISLVGDATTTVEFGTPFVDLGATANDTTDGDITSNIVATGVVDTHHLGTTTLTYTVTNSTGFTASTTRTVIVQCTVNCYDNVMFLPGIEASRLYRPARPDESPVTEHRLWEPLGDLDAEQLFLGASGTSLRSDIYTRDIIDEAYAPFAGPNIYKSFIATMDHLKNDNQINDWAIVPYDWRLSLSDILANGTKVENNIYYTSSSSDPYVLSELRRLAASSKTGKVTLIAHSNGGLVAKALMIQIGDASSTELIGKVVFVSVPQIGTPQALASLLHGSGQGLPSDKFQLFLSAQTSRTFGHNSPMAYNLLPSANYFTQVDDPVISFDESSLPDWIQRYGSTIHSQENLTYLLNDSYERVDFTSADLRSLPQANDLLLSQAQAMHAFLDSWIPPRSIPFIQIAGWGIPSTVKGIEYGKIAPPLCVSLCDLGFAVTASTTIDGDGTVVTPSALWLSATLPNVKNYWVDLRMHNWMHANRDHKNILEVEGLQNFISDTLTGSFKESSEYKFLTAEAPVSSTKRLRYELHSPLTLDLYDNQGHHTGVSTTTGQIEEQIPGTYYMELAGVKYLFTDASSSAHIVMDGYDTGTFTFKVEELQGDTPVTSTTFRDIPTTPETMATMDILSDITTLSPMKVDHNGDGIPEATLAPSLGGIVLYDTIPPEVTISFSTTTNRIDVIGTDDLSAVMIATTSTSTHISDAAGNALTLSIARNITQSKYVALAIPSFSYSTGTTTAATTSLRYFWSKDGAGKYTLFISAVRTPTARLVALYMPFVNKTYIVNSVPADDEANLSLQSMMLLLRNKIKTYTGLYIPNISTKEGRVVIH